MIIQLNKLFPEYLLLDCGQGKKIEKFNDIILIRPEITGKEKSNIDYYEWLKIAHAEFVETSKKTGYWKVLKPIPESWKIKFSNQSYKINLELKLSNSKHIGIFPEQVLTWNFLYEMQNELKGAQVLNLFGYTGSNSVWAAKMANTVTHVDSVKKIVDWTKINSQLSEIKNIRFIVDDAYKFVLKEIKRNRKYSFIILDPPAVGMGSANERWILTEMLGDLLKNLRYILEEKSFIIMNLYSHELSKEQIKKYITKIYPDFEILFFEKIFGLSASEKTIDHGYFIRLRR